MHQILDSRKEQAIVPLLRLGFRPFFLFGGLFALLAILIWFSFYHGWITLSAIANPIWWHAHEMLFGFAGAIVVGFLLTAVQNWTAYPSLKGGKLACIVTLWAIPRLLLPWLGASHSGLMLIDLSWMLLCTLFLAIPIVRVRQWRNLFFVPLLLLFTSLNAASWLMQQQGPHLSQLLLATLLLFCLLIAIMGGRVIPFFTARGTGYPVIRALVWLDNAALSSLWVLFFAWLLLPNTLLTSPYLTALCLLTASLHAARWLRWRFFSTRHHPLLWSLHIAYGFMVLGLLALAGFCAGLDWPITTLSHLLSIGCLGGMILAMVARVSLGHSGRPLQLNRLMPWAFALITIAALARAVLPWLWPQWSLYGWDGAALAWSLAWLIFIYSYAAILSRPRIDGHPG